MKKFVKKDMQPDHSDKKDNTRETMLVSCPMADDLSTLSPNMLPQGAYLRH